MFLAKLTAYQLFSVNKLVDLQITKKSLIFASCMGRQL